MIPLERKEDGLHLTGEQALKLSRFIPIYEHGNPRPFANFEYEVQKMFEGISLQNRNILEVGCGVGFLSQLIAIMNPDTHILALDEAEGDGSSRDVLDVMRKNNEVIGIENITVVKGDFNIWQPDGPFDIIIARNAIHHIPWKEPITPESNAFIFSNKAVHDDFLGAFHRLRSMLVPGGHLIFRDVARDNIYRFLPRSIALKIRGVNWRLKPTRKEWLSLLREAGFDEVGSSCVIPYRVRYLQGLWSAMGGHYLVPDFNFFGRNP